MNVRQGSLIKEVQDSRTNTSWIPTTPGKPGLATLPLISGNGQENQQDQVDWSESQTKQAAPRGTKSEVYGDGIKMYTNFSSDDVDMWSNASFGDLLAMAHAGGAMPAANANDGTTYSVESSSAPCSTSQKAGGFSIFSSFPFNLSSPPRMTDAISSSNISFQFEPVTPDLIKSKGQASNASKLGIDVTTVARGIQSSEDTLKRSEANELHLNKEQSVLVLGQSELQENRKPDNEDKQDTELNNTSQQKQRRRKHRPKVVIEGKPKRTPKPRREKQPGPGETKTEKRKYVRRNKAGTPAATSVEEVSNTICHEGKPPSSKTTPTAKRKYVRYKLVTKRTGKPSEEGSGGKFDPTKVSRPTKSCKSCRRSLNFEFESQASNENSSYRPSTTLDLHVNQTRSVTQSAQLGQGIQPTTQETGAGTTYDITCSPNQELRNDFSQPDMQYPSPPTPDKVALNHDRFMVGNKNESTRGNCGIFFSDLAHDKQASILQMTPKSPNISNCSTDARLLHGKGLKRQHSYRTDKAQFYNINARGVYFNSMQAYQAIFPANEADIYSNLGMYHDVSYKKKRTEIGQSSATSYSKPSTSEIIQVTPSRCNISGSPSNISATNSANNRMQNSDFMPTLVKTERLSKRANGATGVRDLASLHQIYKQFQISTSKEAAHCGFGARYETSNLPNACMEAPVTNTRAAIKTKKQSKTSILLSSTASNMHTQQQSTTNARGPMPTITQRGMSPVDEITVHLQHLDLNRESSQNQDQQRIITYHTKFQGESALVLYQRDGSIVPFDSPFARKRKTRPRVDVDDETDRVWKLLLQDINNEGIDGTDEDKAKWWEEERRVFSSRADSFIARMHLVQGDRRFSPWKGSVLDSVVGVFLTQNVSDHLSSSAFMSLAAQFPLKSKNSSQKHEERTGIIIEEPEVCATDPDVTIRWREDQPNEPSHGQDSSSNTDSNGEKAAVNSNASNENSTCCTKSAEHSVVLQSDSSREGLDLYPESTVNCFQDQRELDDLSSSPSSVVSSQNSAVVQSTERTESIDFYGSTSFTKLLEMAGTSVAQGTRCDEHLQSEQSGSLTELGHPSLYAKMMTEFYSSCSCHQNELVRETVKGAEVNVEQHFQVKDRSWNEAATFSETIVDGKERASIVIDPCNSEQRAVESNWKNVTDHADSTVGTVNGNPSKANIARPGKEKQNIDWDSLRLQAQANGKKRERSANTMDSLDWEAVRCANVNEIAHTIRERGMNNKLAERIKDFLNRLVREHGSTDLEWLRDVPPDKAKEYLLSFRGLGLKSVECVRLLTLHHLAFPVDTNVGRIAVRLGWVPLQPLPESLQLHLLELYPILESIQQYLWPRLCKLDQKTLYELHYQMITFGKVFCTKSRPNCNACPMRGECRHFASAFARCAKLVCFKLTHQYKKYNHMEERLDTDEAISCLNFHARLALPGPEEKSIVRATENIAANENPGRNFTPLPLPLPPNNQQPMEHQKLINSAPIIEEPATPEPIVEIPATPEQEQIQASEIDIEDAYFEDPSEIPLIELNMAEFTQNVKKYVENNMELHQVEMSKALVALTSGAASIPVPKLKNISRLRTEHHVYELPDTHPLLEGLDRREPDDPCPYLLSIWTPGETANSIQPPEKQCNSQESGNLCDNETCSACNSARETHSQTVRGTILIPCRTAMRGSFPLNGTYFQVNEVFADHESSLIPINVPRDWLWNLPRRTVYFGTSIPTIFKGLTTESIQHCFWRGFVCVRGFDRKTRAPRPLIARFHFPASKLIKTKGKTGEDRGVAK